MANLNWVIEERDQNNVNRNAAETHAPFSPFSDGVYKLVQILQNSKNLLLSPPPPQTFEILSNFFTINLHLITYTVSLVNYY